MPKKFARNVVDAVVPPNNARIHLMHLVFTSSENATTFWVPHLRAFCQSLLPWIKISYSTLKHAMDQHHAQYLKDASGDSTKTFLLSSNPILISTLADFGVVDPFVTSIQATRLSLILDWMSETFKGTSDSAACQEIILGIRGAYAFRLVQQTANHLI